jgi:hypothetical protein
MQTYIVSTTRGNLLAPADQHVIVRVGGDKTEKRVRDLVTNEIIWIEHTQLNRQLDDFIPVFEQQEAYRAAQNQLYVTNSAGQRTTKFRFLLLNGKVPQEYLFAPRDKTLEEQTRSALEERVSSIAPLVTVQENTVRGWLYRGEHLRDETIAPDAKSNLTALQTINPAFSELTTPEFERAYNYLTTLHRVSMRVLTRTAKLPPEERRKIIAQERTEQSGQHFGEEIATILGRYSDEIIYSIIPAQVTKVSPVQPKANNASSAASSPVTFHFAQPTTVSDIVPINELHRRHTILRYTLLDFVYRHNSATAAPEAREKLVFQAYPYLLFNEMRTQGFIDPLEKVYIEVGRVFERRHDTERKKQGDGEQLARYNYMHVSEGIDTGDIDRVGRLPPGTFKTAHEYLKRIKATLPADVLLLDALEMRMVWRRLLGLTKRDIKQIESQTLALAESVRTHYNLDVPKREFISMYTMAIKANELTDAPMKVVISTDDISRAQRQYKARNGTFFSLAQARQALDAMGLGALKSVYDSTHIEENPPYTQSQTNIFFYKRPVSAP